VRLALKGGVYKDLTFDEVSARPEITASAVTRLDIDYELSLQESLIGARLAAAANPFGLRAAHARGSESGSAPA
jgi:hypothetical protein